MGNANQSDQNFQKGEGYRIVQVSEDSPFAGKVEQFFDFIVDIIAPQPEKSAGDILNKLSQQPQPKLKQSPMQILNENVGKVISVKIVSTKYRNIRTIEVDLSKDQPQNNDKIGLTVRKERYDEVFDTYFPVADIQNNSPVKKANIRQGQYLIACIEYPYKTIDAFMEGLYQRFFDKEIKEKNVHLALYDIVTDNLLIREVVLKRGWGGRGLLGCEFLQGLLNKFPNNLEQQRKSMREEDNKKREVEKLRNQLGDCDGASKSLIESLHSQNNSKAKHFRNIKNLLSVQPPIIAPLNKLSQSKSQEQPVRSEQKAGSSSDSKKISELEQRVALLEQSLFSVREYLNKMELIEENNQS